ncbi:MAG: hypothetical protein ACKPGI_16010 [Verrucomicrobiota bacterium]
MIERWLQTRLRPLERRRSWRDRLLRLGVGWAFVAGLALLIHQASGPTGTPALVTFGLALVAVTGGTLWRTRQRGSDEAALRDLARRIEAGHPGLDGRLSAALDQRRDGSGALNFLQQRLILEAIEASYREPWARPIPRSQIVGAALVSCAALGLALFTLQLFVRDAARPLPVAETPRPDLEVTPGSVEIEKGSSLVVLARFGGEVPATARLVVRPNTGTTNLLPLTRTLGDPVFGGTVPDVRDGFRYRVEAGSKTSPEFEVTVFEFPRLERSDADLVYPAYTGLAPRTVPDTRRLSAVEGTGLTLHLQLNKPVREARLLPRGGSNQVLDLVVSTNQAVATLAGYTPVQGGTYDLVLRDAEGRTNRTPASFSLEVLPNRTPELKLVRPRGDQRPSPLEELRFEGTAWDDFGLLAYGLGFTVGAGEPRLVVLGTNAPAQEKRTLNQPIALEPLGVAPDDLVSWFLWADDVGPDGAVRRTQTDLFLGEIRPFDEIFREQTSSSSNGGGQESGNQEGSPTTRLAELQKQILNATWKIERQRPRATAESHGRDLGTVTESQSQALDQAKDQGSGAEDPRGEALWGAVMTAMEKALSELNASTNRTQALTSAIAAETAAYQALLRLREREFQVARNRGQRQQGGREGGDSMRQRQLEELDLTDEANRYETESTAQTATTPERQEQLQVLNRLGELARRQQDLNERLRELQAELAKADSESQREEIRRQLKRLQEEEQQMLSDADELRQRMDRAENQSRFAEQRRQLEQTRDQMQRASEAASQGSPSQALAAGTRAEEQLEQMREQVRRESAGAFAEELRQMRQAARDLTRNQDQVRRDLAELGADTRRSLSGNPKADGLVQELERQQQRLTNLLSEVAQVSEAAEASEPTVSRQLYDTLRQLNQDDAGLVKQVQEELIRRGQMSRSLYDRLEATRENPDAKALQVMRDLVQEGRPTQARDVDTKATQSLNRLQRGLERAAANVIGDDTEALEKAGQELDRLAQALDREAASEAPESSPASTPGPGGESQAEGSGTTNPTASTPQRGGSSGSTPGSGSPSEPRSEAPSSSEPSNAQAGTPGGTSPSRTPARPSGRPGTPNPGSQGGQDAGDAGANPFSGLLEGGSASTGTGGGPMTGESFGEWSDRLRDVEENLDDPQLRSRVASARESARLVRLGARRDRQKPDWAQVRLKVLAPLVEVRRQIQEELRRRNPGDSLVPIDRDPVPSRYAESVRRYYENLGKE